MYSRSKSRFQVYRKRRFYVFSVFFIFLFNHPTFSKQGSLYLLKATLNKLKTNRS